MNKKIFLLFLILVFSFISFNFGFSIAKEDNKRTGSFEKLEIYYFYSSRCGACQKVKKEVLPRIKKKFKDNIEIKFFNVLNKNDYKIMLAVLKKFDLSEKEKGLVPKIIINDKVLIGYKEINKKIDKIIKKTLVKDKEILKINSGITPENNILMKKFKKFNIWGVVGAGLIDGINPCAFATIIFFISFLGVAGYKKKELANIGIFFILAVFITYFLLGFGLFNFLFHLQIYDLLSKVLYILIILFTDRKSVV